jgi:putative membrane protein
MNPTTASTPDRNLAKHKKYLLVLGVLFAMLWAALAINPRYRDDWLVENILVLSLVVLVALTFKRFTLSRISYTLIFLFLCLHEIGAHYTYAEVPYNEWFKSLSGTTLNSLLGWQRNNFDRVIHFCYGLLFAYPIREIFLRVVVVRGFWGYFLPLDLTLSTSAIYELCEWLVAEVLGGDLGQAYLGTQGDVWDAHKDMAFASLGAFIAMLITLAANYCLQSDFAAEWTKSLKVKKSQPLGEDAIAHMLDEKK